MKKSKYPGVRNGQVEAVINKMGGLPILDCFLSGKLVMEWVVWKTLTFDYKDVQSADYLTRLKDCCQLGNRLVKRNYVRKALEKIVEIPVGKVDLVKLTGKELGFSDSVSLREVSAKAMRLGLKMCPWAIGPELVLQFTDKEEGKYVLVVMEPVVGQYIFYVKNWWRSVPRSLELTTGPFSNLFPWVFVKPTK